MNLKFYLRGLGLGFIVAALVLGIHHFRSDDNKMSDAQIKARAEELGMVDSATYLSQDDTPDAEELLESLNEEDSQAYDDPDGALLGAGSGDEESEPAQVTDGVETDATVEETTAAEEASPEPAASDETAQEATAADETVQDDPAAQGAEETTTDEIESRDTPQETADAAGSDEKTHSTGGNLQINSGDSSDRVARKLQDAGIVSSAAEFDLFLCNNGYDRYIRTGTYNIPAGSTDREIADMITGR